MFTIEGIAESCPLCFDGDGRKNGKPIVFTVSSPRLYCGPICAGHLCAIIKSQMKAPKQEEPFEEATIFDGHGDCRA